MIDDGLKNEIAKLLCDIKDTIEFSNCFQRGCKRGLTKCLINEKTNEQLKYILTSNKENVFLSACPGSGKTEVVSIKAAYEIKNWKSINTGIAFVTFTNNARDVIVNRIFDYLKFSNLKFPHFVGTLDSWIHNYIVQPLSTNVIDFPKDRKDYSIRIIDESSSVGFINNYSTRYSYVNHRKILANQYYFSLDKRRIFFSSGKQNSAIDELRNNMDLEEWKYRDLLQAKENFLTAGFATYTDMENLCYEILQKKEFGELICKRFPLIIIDECQDLSIRQLEILQLLIDYGSKIHLIGDLDQSIYDFKQVNPEKINEFCLRNNFIYQNLNNNFRSSPNIVNVCNRIINKVNASGNENKIIDNPCVCLVYPRNEISQVPNTFLNYLNERVEKTISVSDSAILSRNYSTLNKLRNSINLNNQAICSLPFVINIWNQYDTISFSMLEESLEKTGILLAKNVFSGTTFNSREQYRPEFIASSVVWRQFLASLIMKLSETPEICNLNQKWAMYSKSLREKFPDLLASIITDFKIVVPDTVEIKNNFRAPSGKAVLNVGEAFSNENTEIQGKLRMTTIHKAKGETLDAVLLLSKTDNRGNSGGYWENWLSNPSSESARFAYVASSRPQFLLMWGIPEETITKENYNKLFGWGFKFINLAMELWEL